MTTPGILLVDKPQGITSHDVVARARRALGTRRVGHAGTLDPMATGLLVLGVERSTKLLTYLVGLGKTYTATIRLGQSTTTDDAEGETTATADASSVAAVTDDAIARGIARLTGEIDQVPSTVSAIKVQGRRAYDLARAGEDVTLAARTVTISRFDVLDTRRHEAHIELDVVVDCSSGTYIRALARDLGADVGVGGHLSALRRTRIGDFDVADAVMVDDVDASALRDEAVIASAVLGRIDVTADDALRLWQGKRLEGQAGRLPSPDARAAAIDDAGRLVGVVERRGDDLRSVMNMPAPVEAGGTR
ncbi:tRNA pseudouridine(55) synthase TruB [uncultured Microbacterium sp.]|uniref:tRNA pseudouridine(55) synthase TruB n=1 Tax=uncultured Microbacterium sp. TaxID=191216 RepID=UPI0025E5D04A|nr:tRNA pseudouridine(55) synthase TruB [uncultured Microbacterium sp.]